MIKANEMNEHKIRKLRKDIHGLLEQYRDIYSSVLGGERELDISKQKLQEARMWLGKVLEEIGSELPKEYRDQ